MRGFLVGCGLLWGACASAAYATIFGAVRGVVHDPQHRPVAGARVEVHAAASGFVQTAVTAVDGGFSFAAVPLGEYRVTVSGAGFAEERRELTLASDTSAVLHVELRVGAVREEIRVEGAGASVDSVTPSVLIDRAVIAATPGADRTNSLAMITDFVPGAYMTHDMLHIRGGHQVSWLIDGVEIPNTNIASTLGAQIDPKDIDYIEVQRGSYTADVGDRTYGVFNVVPRTGFERDREAEVVLSAGSFLQTNNQVSFGDHTERLAYYASLSGNRTNYGLAPPIWRVYHDAANGYGGFGSMIWNRTPKDQFRAVAQLREDYFQIPYDPDPDSFENQQFYSSGLRDGQWESDAVMTASWLHTFGPSTVLQVSPFYHRNRARYKPGVNDAPVATTSERTSDYGGGQAAVTGTVARNTVQAGVYGFGQRDGYVFGAVFNDGSGSPAFSIPDSATGGVMEEYLSDNWKAAEWLTLIGGVRATRFQGQFVENVVKPRVGAAVRVPKLGWVFRVFYGRFYQPPPLLTASGPVVQFAQANDTDFQPLHGERDEEHQFGVQIPWRGWVVDADTFKTRVNDFLDHSNIGNSSIYYPVTVDGALVRAWELTVRTPKLGRFGQGHLAYSNQIAEQHGAITGGLVCAPVGSPQCDASSGYRPVDHDQRNTLSVGWNTVLPWRLTMAGNLAYGSGFVNGSPDPATPYPNAYLSEHTTMDLSVGRSFGERITASVTGTNVTNRRVLLDNSLTFGGFHYNDPREVFGEVRYRFRY